MSVDERRAGIKPHFGPGEGQPCCAATRRDLPLASLGRSDLQLGRPNTHSVLILLAYNLFRYRSRLTRVHLPANWCLPSPFPPLPV